MPTGEMSVAQAVYFEQGTQEMFERIEQSTLNTDVYIRVLVFIIMLGISSFIAWKLWSRLILPYIKSFIKFPF